jgi:hypothetical protein
MPSHRMLHYSAHGPESRRKVVEFLWNYCVIGVRREMTNTAEIAQHFYAFWCSRGAQHV